VPKLHFIGISFDLIRLIQVTVREHLSSWCRRRMTGRSRISQIISTGLLTSYRSVVFIDTGNSDNSTSPVGSRLETTSKNLCCGTHTGCAKNDLTCFCQNFVKSSPNLIIFGIQIAKTIEICSVHSLSTSPCLCQRTTV